MATDINITPTGDMPPVTTTTSGSTTGTTSSGITPSAEALQANTLEQEALKAQAGFTEAQGEQIPVVKGQEAAGLDEQAAARSAAALEAEQVRQNYLDRIKYATVQSDRARQRYESFQFHNYWDSLSTAQHIQSRIASFMGGFVQGVNGGPNVALQALQSAADRDFEAQKAQLSKSEKSADWAAKGVTDLYGQMQHDMAALEVKHSLALKAVADKAQAALIRAGIPAAQAANDATVQGLMAGSYAKDLAAKQRYENHFDRQQTSKAESQTTSAKAGAGGVEADKNAANFAVLKNHGEWIAKTMPTLSQEDIKAVRAVMGTEDFLQGDGGVRAGLAAAAAKLGFDPETGVSPKAKEYLDRVRRAAEGLGRVQSGAAIGSIENKRFVGSLMPMASDRPEDLKGRAGRIVEDINSRGAYLERKPRTPQVGAAGTEKLPKEQIKANIRKANQWIADHPTDPEVWAARKQVAQWHVDIGGP
jgi:hypothetical protein